MPLLDALAFVEIRFRVANRPFVFSAIRQYAIDFYDLRFRKLLDLAAMAANLPVGGRYLRPAVDELRAEGNADRAFPFVLCLDFARPAITETTNGAIELRNASGDEDAIPAVGGETANATAPAIEWQIAAPAAALEAEAVEADLAFGAFRILTAAAAAITTCFAFIASSRAIAAETGIAPGIDAAVVAFLETRKARALALDAGRATTAIGIRLARFTGLGASLLARRESITRQARQRTATIGVAAAPFRDAKAGVWA